MAKQVTPRPALKGRARAKKSKENAETGWRTTCKSPKQDRKEVKNRPLDRNSFLSVATEIAELTAEKNAAYGNAFSRSGDFLRLLYPDGIRPEQYGDALALVRIFDKQMRIANRKDAFGENPYRDIAGYGLLGAVKDGK